MDVEIWRPWTRWVLLEPSAWEYVLVALELLLSLAILFTCRRDFAKLGRRRFLLLVACLAAPLFSERFLVMGFAGRNLLPPPGVPFSPSRPLAPLLGMLPVVVAGAWLGPGPALLVGLSKGILRAGVTASSIAAAFHLGLFGVLVGFLLRQDYWGRLPSLARQPIIAVPLMTPFAALLLLVSTFAHVAESGLSGLDYALTLTSSYSIPLLVESLVAALAIQAVYQLLPHCRPVRIALLSPPYARTLNRRLLFLFVPVIGLITVVVVYAVTATALRLAVSETVNQMVRDANSAAEGIPTFIQTGQGLLMAFANDEQLWRTEEDVLEDRLIHHMRMVVFFDQFVLLDSRGQPLAVYPNQPTGAPQLTTEEYMLLERGIESGAPQISSVHRSTQDEVILSFLAPMRHPLQEEGDGPVSRVLVGRSRLDVNPMIGRILQDLQWTDARGVGFIVDSRGHIVAHVNPDMLLKTWRVDEGRSRIDASPRGRAYESRDPRDNTRQLVYYLPVEGYPWGVVVRLSYDMVLEQARQIATPLLGLQTLLGGGLVVIISLVTNWVTQPLQQLADAADRIAEGDLSQPVEISGPAADGSQDEVVRLGVAFEDMRLRLRDRMEDLSLLLDVSQSVSATLELTEGISFILEGALRAAEAQVARVVLLSADGRPQTVLSRGGFEEGLQDLDRALAQTTRERGEALVLENLRRAKTLLGSEVVKGPIKAVIALPVRAKEQVAAVMWVGYGTVRRFNASDIDLLSTLASQTSVLVENARLFQTVESERGRLAAILASTTDAVVVTDCEDHILLMNPAAERVFGVEEESVSGQVIARTPLPKALVEVFREPLDPDEALTRELALSDGRTLYANLSAILGADGQLLGRVSVMRDITHLKELDELKSDFVAAVSHDLRAPLAVIRGYAKMLPTVGELNQSQQEYVDRIRHGISQMRNLVDDLLALGRIEANVSLESHPCHLGAIVADAVDSRQAHAVAKDIKLQMESAIRDPLDTGSESGESEAAIVSGDAALLRQAITNLVDNAIKYTPSGGRVVVGLSTTPASKSEPKDLRRWAQIRVSDTGIGIAPEDQVRLFEKFYRVTRRDGPDVPGTGLGLSIVRSIVERHHGSVRVDSELNQGSTFTITLPLIDGDPV